MDPKVFGVGMQRTGTTSLGRALTLLGYKTIHFPSWLWEMEDPSLLDQYEAFTDNPIPLLYKDLDERHPGSKFILTVRNEEKWLASCQWMFETKREDWGFDRSTRIQGMHHALYGTNHFDRDAFSAAYRRHNADVIAYFADRHDDLLVLDVDAGLEWGPLCAFLGQPVPSAPFPHSNKGGVLSEAKRRLKRLLGPLWRLVRGRR